MQLNVIDDFLNKKVCPYCGHKLEYTQRFGDLKCSNKECNAEFGFIDSPGPDGYYFPRNREVMPYYEKVLKEGIKLTS